MPPPLERKERKRYAERLLQPKRLVAWPWQLSLSLSMKRTEQRQ